MASMLRSPRPLICALDWHQHSTVVTTKSISNLMQRCRLHRWLGWQDSEFYGERNVRCDLSAQNMKEEIILKIYVGTRSPNNKCNEVFILLKISLYKWGQIFSHFKRWNFEFLSNRKIVIDMFQRRGYSCVWN